MYTSYIISLYCTNILLLLFIKENDYRQGLDYNILNIHLHSVLITYISFTILIIFYVLNLVTMKYKKWIYIINKISLYSALSLILSGGFWSWSQWGTIQFYDIKILITIIIISVFYTVNIISNISKNFNNFLFFYNIYILYHIPLLKYNVIWNSEIHQKSTFHMIESFMVNYSSIFFAIIILISIIVYFDTIRLYNLRIYYSNRLTF